MNNQVAFFVLASKSALSGAEVEGVRAILALDIVKRTTSEQEIWIWTKPTQPKPL